MTAQSPDLRPADGGRGPSVLDAHLAHLAEALLSYRECEGLLARWGRELAGTLVAGGRLLVAGNGGSAAEAQHLTAELVGKLRHDREPLSAIALHAETSAMTAIGNDYGYDEVFARQVRAHGRPGDILLLLSTSGTSPNLLTAAHAGHATGLRTWAFTGPAPNPLADACHEALAVSSPDGQVVQELHLVSAHVLCEYVDRALAAAPAAATEPVPDAATGSVPGAATGPVPAGTTRAGPVRTGVEVVLGDREVEPERGGRA
ncbi:D-sedoheptulose-7-phosphate isomerase [Micromonospora mirobrigensis]|uniref:D-sedoheptulose 7-phosphate isomerase n=1 Tax=Micromonospora mirobrigensis TaxID=262898 RepID=A0A1C4ZCR9_9ACTN|nr:SIS domain-containing protein [Micromonospora mirobrigensis]SCF30626.1 D-sedoheptulose 7-phosphate isomerase [Micromonospora mirobrigensis]